jgi:predicted glutamine amidotransferase
VIQEHLVTDPNSLKNLSYSNDDGWSVGYYPDGGSEPIVNRGKSPAYSDPLFDDAVAEAAGTTPSIAVSHVRNCSSGLCDIANPHPFEREKNGKYWLMGHNGTIDKTALLSLIRPDYLAANPPAYGIDQSQWIDSELYFIFMLQTLEDYKWDIKPALGHVIQCLRDKIPGTGEQLNFFLTDGTTLCGYRQGKSLYYCYDKLDTPYSALASQYPSSSQGNWVTVSDGQLITMNQGVAPVVENIENYFVGPPPDFSLSANQSTISFTSGGSGTFNVSIVPSGGLAGNVALTASASANVTVIPASVTVVGPPYAATAFTVTSSTPGTYTVTVTGTSGSLRHQTSVTLTVKGPALSVRVSTDKGSYTVGQTVTITVTVTSAGLPIGGAAVVFSIKGRFGSTARSGSGTTTPTGTLQFTWNTKGASRGSYTVQVSASKTGYTSGSGSSTFTLR